MLKWFNNLKLATRLLLVTMLILGCVVTVNYVVFVRGYQERAQHALADKAAAFTAVADQTKEHVSLLHRTGAFDVKTMTAEMKKDLAEGKRADETRMFKAVPVVAGWTAAQDAANRENIEFRLLSFNARNPKNEPKPGSFEEKLLRDLNSRVAAKGGTTAYAINEATNSLHFVRAIQLTENCLACHGAPGSKWDVNGNGKDIAGYRMEGWSAGDTHGAYHVVMPLAPIQTQVGSFLTNGLLWTAPLVVLAIVLLAWFIAKAIRRPIAGLTEHAHKISQGDLTQDLPQDMRQRQDEVGELATAMQNMGDGLRDMLRNVSGGVQTLIESSSQLSAISTQMSSGAKQTTGKAATVAAAAEEMSANTASVASGMESASTNLASVATATEEMTATVGEIASNSDKARAITSQAAQQAAKASDLVKELGQAAQEIGKVTETITSISAQTNLLALNATIEAARAGAAGKGFAVVANEIKELAQQTAKATEDIKHKIGGIQVSTAGTVQDIQGITGVIQQVNEIVTTIATAIDEQSKVTRDIAGNIAQASGGVKDANHRVAETATVSQSIAKDIVEVNHASQDMSHGAEQVQASAGELSRLAQQLRDMVSRYRVGGEQTSGAASHSGGSLGQLHGASGRSSNPVSAKAA